MPITMHTSELTQGMIQKVGEIEREEGNVVVVSTSQGILRAKTALSCVIRPSCGDIVLLATHDDTTYVLSVLERKTEGAIELDFQRTVSITVDGDLALHSSGKTSVEGRTSARLHAPTVDVCGNTVSLTGTHISIAAKALNWLAETMESAARVIKQSSELWSAHAETHQRQIEKLELARMGSLDIRVENVVNVSSCHTIMQSRELTKIDGKQIQVG